MTSGARRAASRLAALLLFLVAAHAFAEPFADTMAQRLLACTGCHDPEGRAAADGYYPRIAGKPAGYLYNQLLNFRDGRRSYALMTNLLAPLDDAYLREIAGHFAGLDLPYPASIPVTLAPADAAAAARLVGDGDPARGLPACNACHGAAMTGTAPFVPGLLGLSRDYLNAQLGAWRNGKRVAQAPDCMAEIAKKLAPQEIGLISAWLAGRPVPAGAKPAAAFNTPMPTACGGVATSGAAGAPR